MLKLTTHNFKALALSHLAKKAIKKIPLYEQNNAYRVNIPFLDEPMNITRYLIFCRIDGEWKFTGAEDKPAPTHL